MALRGVIFDMGGTLLHYHPPGVEPQRGWQAMEDTGAEAVYTLLREQGRTLPPLAGACALSFSVVERHWRSIDDGQNPQLSTILREVLVAWGLPEDALDEGLLDSAVTAYCTALQALVRPLPGAQETLAALHAQGLRLGLVSNTVWPGVFHLEDLERFGLASYLECTLFSADVGIWKPDPRIFHLALEALDLQPDEAAYVGDHPYFDVYGAQQAGLRGIWMWSAAWTNPRLHELEIQPDATLHALSELIGTIQPWT